MKISVQTLEVLKNLSKINTSFIVEEEGNTLRSCTPGNGHVAFAQVPEVMPKFSIYDLNEFLPIASTFPDADFEFGEKSVKISSGKSKFNYSYCAERLIESRPPRSVKMPTPDCEIVIEKATFKLLLQAANSLGVGVIAFKSVNGKIEAQAVSSANAGTPNTFSVEVGDAPVGHNFNLPFSVTTFAKFIPGDYKVKLTAKKINEFSCLLGPDHSITYWVSPEVGYTYEIA